MPVLPTLDFSSQVDAGNTLSGSLESLISSLSSSTDSIDLAASLLATSSSPSSSASATSLDDFTSTEESISTLPSSISSSLPSPHRDVEWTEARVALLEAAMREVQGRFKAYKTATMTWLSKTLFWITAGYDSYEEFLAHTSSKSTIERTRAPLLALNAKDDPLAPLADLPLDAFRNSDCAAMVLTSHGGHLGWNHTRKERKRTGYARWSAMVIAKWFGAIEKVRLVLCTRLAH